MEMKESTEAQAKNSLEFDMSPFTAAPMQFDMRIRFRGKTPEEVFGIMGDPQRITDWFLLAQDVLLQPPGPDGQVDFDVVFVFFGRVREEILHWEMPARYVYSAAGKNFPIRDYVALIEINQTGPAEGEMVWKQYFDVIEGEHNQRILPVILPPIYEVSMNRLAPMIGGTCVEVNSFMEAP